MSTPLIAAIDIGKTHAKIAFIDAGSGAEIWSEKRANRIIATPLGRRLDIDEIERWLLEELQRAPHKKRVTAIVPIAHGAAVVLLDKDGNVVAAPDYEDPQFGGTDDGYEKQRDAFTQTFSPRLPLGLNLARQLFVLEGAYPEAFARTAHVLLYPQYWAWRLSGVLASEVTSLGCHTDLWRAREAAFSTLALTHHWDRLFPPLRCAGDELGTLTESMVARTELDPACRVLCGIHDSNACWLQYSIGRARADSFAVVSSGTWTVAMANGADPRCLRAERDMLANVDAFGSIVCTARFMGGREYEVLAEADTAPDAITLAAVVEQRVMAIPAFASGGPYAASSGKLLRAGRPIQAHDLSGQERAAIATLYIALMTDVLLESLEVRADTIIDGPFAGNPLFAPLLAALRRSSAISLGAASTSAARAVCHLAGVQLPRAPAARSVEPLQVRRLEPYRAEWRQLLPERS